MRILSLLALAACAAAAPAAPLELRDGDRVVFVGNTLIEREQQHGYWELALTARFPGKKITFRNLGWSGDTVFGEARAGFGSPAEGYRQLIEHTLALKPTVLFVAYGTNESFQGAAGLPRFTRQLETLLGTLEKTGAKIILLGPLRQADMGRPLPDPARNNQNLRLYADAIREVAQKRKHDYVDLYERLGDLTKVDPPATYNGIHLTKHGYRWSALELQKALGLAPADARLEDGSESAAREKLRRLIVEKNELYFHRWRPQNVTYLFGFRKHEQGNNAVEIPKFDPLIEVKEKEIHDLARSLSAR
ncbi:MAG: SGNH/GDSL hydrolase family protein [Gemmataceae bacterium]